MAEMLIKGHQPEFKSSTKLQNAVSEKLITAEWGSDYQLTQETTSNHYFHWFDDRL